MFWPRRQGDRASQVARLETEVRRIIHEDPAAAPERIGALALATVLELRWQDAKIQLRPFLIASSVVTTIFGVAAFGVGMLIGHWVWH